MGLGIGLHVFEPVGDAVGNGVGLGVGASVGNGLGLGVGEVVGDMLGLGVTQLQHTAPHVVTKSCDYYFKKNSITATMEQACTAIPSVSQHFP